MTRGGHRLALACARSLRQNRRVVEGLVLVLLTLVWGTAFARVRVVLDGGPMPDALLSLRFRITVVALF